MTRIEVYLLAIALAMDAFTVGAGVGVRCCTTRERFRLSFHFGLFQSLFAGLGAAAGTLILPMISSWDHWLMFGILALLGGRMIWQAFHESDQMQRVDLTRGINLVGLSVAVSLDALGAGISLPNARIGLGESIVAIGITSLVATWAAMRFGRRAGDAFGKIVETAAGLVLIGLGVNILLAHLGAG